MSVAQQPVIRLRDPRVAIEQAPLVAIDQGAEAIDHRRSPSNTFTASQISFNEISTSGTSSILSRKMFIEYGYAVSFSVRGDALPAGNGDYRIYGNGTNTAVLDSNNPALGLNFDIADLGEHAAGGNIPYYPAITAELKARGCLNNLLILAGIQGPRRVGPRSLGLLQSVKTLGVTINGNTITSNLGDYINALEWYDNHGGVEHADYSKCASYPDLFKTYREGVFKQTNPLASYGSQLSREPRGALWNLPTDQIVSDVIVATLVATPAGTYYCIDGFAFQIIEVTVPGGVPTFVRVGDIRLVNDLTEHVATLAQVIANQRYFRMVEPIVLPIFNIGQPDARGLIGVEKLSIDLSLSSAKLSQKWLCGDINKVPGGYVGDLNHNVVMTLSLPESSSSSYLHYEILRPHEIPELPSSNVYSNKRISVNTKEIAFTQSGVNTGFDSGSYQFGSIPSRIYIFIKEDTESTQIQDTDVFARIDKLSFQFGSAGTQYSSLETEGLYSMSKASGLKMSLPQWRDHVGSVCCIDFTRNVNLSIGEYPGLLTVARFNFNLSATVLRKTDRLAGQPVSPMKVYMVVVEEGVATIQDQSMQLMVGTLQIDPSTVPIRYKVFDEKWQGMYGGSFVDSLKKVGHTVGTAVQKSLPYVKKALPYIEKGLAMALPLLAAGGGVSHEKAIKMVHKHGAEEAVRMLKKLSKARAGSLVGGDMYGGAKKAKGGAKTSKSEMSRFLKS